jgi:hypothetical protein
MINRWFILAVTFFLLAWAGVAAQSLSTRSTSAPETIAQSKPQPPAPVKKSQPAPPTAAPTPPPPAPAPVSPPTSRPAPQPVAPASTPPPNQSGSKVDPKMLEEINKEIVTPQMNPQQLMRELERDKSRYPVEIWCKDVNTCAAKVVRKEKDTQWRAGLFMNEEVYYQTNRKYAALGFDFGNGQSFTDSHGVVLHQAVWLKNR